MKKYKHSIKEIYFFNRWSIKHPSDDWCIFGLVEHWYSHNGYEYRLCFFGIELRFGFWRIRRS